MAPISVEEERATPDGITNALQPGNPARVWILVGITLGAVVIVAATIFVAIRLAKRRQYQLARKRDPYMSKQEFARRRKLSASERWQEEELERSIMIRKSLLSRTSFPISQVESRHVEMQEDGEEEEEEEEGNLAAGLREEWKEMEARLQSERSLTRERHPSLTTPEPIMLAPVRSLDSRETRLSSPLRPPHMVPRRETAEIHEVQYVRLHNATLEWAGAPVVAMSSPGPVHMI